jgi:hypothetical protein
MTVEQKPYGCKIMVCVVHDDLLHEVATASLRSKVPFTKQGIDSFIASSDFITTIKAGITGEDKQKEVKTIFVICNNLK